MTKIAPLQSQNHCPPISKHSNRAPTHDSLPSQVQICVNLRKSVSVKMMTTRAFCDSFSGPCAVSSLIRARPKRKTPTARRLECADCARTHASNLPHNHICFLPQNKHRRAVTVIYTKVNIYDNFGV